LRTPISVRGHSGGITVTVLRYAETGQYVHDFSSPAPIQLHQTLAAAQADADVTVRAVGHVCGEGCSGWRCWTRRGPAGWRTVVAFSIRCLGDFAARRHRPGQRQHRPVLQRSSRGECNRPADRLRSRRGQRSPGRRRPAAVARPKSSRGAADACGQLSQGSWVCSSHPQHPREHCLCPLFSRSANSAATLALTSSISM
jgi:hypothetical protein